MTLIDEASAAIRSLYELTSGFGTGSTPDPHSVLGYQSKIVDLHARLGQEMAQRFGKKESAYLTRKIAEAKQYRHGRVELQKTGARRFFAQNPAMLDQLSANTLFGFAEPPVDQKLTEYYEMIHATVKAHLSPWERTTTADTEIVPTQTFEVCRQSGPTVLNGLSEAVSSGIALCTRNGLRNRLKAKLRLLDEIVDGVSGVVLVPAQMIEDRCELVDGVYDDSESFIEGPYLPDQGWFFRRH